MNESLNITFIHLYNQYEFKSVKALKATTPQG